MTWKGPGNWAISAVETSRCWVTQRTFFSNPRWRDLHDPIRQRQLRVRRRQGRPLRRRREPLPLRGCRWGRPRRRRRPAGRSRRRPGISWYRRTCQEACEKFDADWKSPEIFIPGWTPGKCTFITDNVVIVPMGVGMTEAKLLGSLCCLWIRPPSR